MPEYPRTPRCLFAALVVFLSLGVFAGCGGGSGGSPPPDTSPPELRMTLLGGVFRMDCDPDGACPPAPNLGSPAWSPETVRVPLNLWGTSDKEIAIDVRALDVGGVKEIGVNLSFPGGMTILDDGGADVATVGMNQILTLRGDPATVAAALSTRVIIQLLTLGDHVTIDAWATDRADNTVYTDQVTVQIE